MKNILKRIVSTFLIAGTLLLPATPAMAQTATPAPSEYISRGYTEALGRMSDTEGWNFWQQWFSQRGCNTETLTAYSQFVYGSSEFNALGYTPRQKVMSVYRSVLGRDGDQGGIDYWTARSQTPEQLRSSIKQITHTPEFQGLSQIICNPNKSNFQYGAGNPYIAGPLYSQSQIQQILNGAPSGTTVKLPKSGGMIIENGSLIVPRGITLTTTDTGGALTRSQYLSMFRIVASVKKSSGTPVIQLAPGAKLKSVWVDGKIGQSPTKIDAVNIKIAPTEHAATSVERVRSESPRGAQNIYADGYTTRESSGNGPLQNDTFCTAPVTITDNLIINSANDPQKNDGWSDGISTSCNNTTISRNNVIDASDVALIAYHSGNSSPNASVISDNRVLNAGNTAFGGLVLDPLYKINGIYDSASCRNPKAHQQSCVFTTRIENNSLATGSKTHIVFGIAGGTRAWSFLTTRGVTGVGGTIKNNTTDNSSARMQVGVYLSGIQNTTVQNNFNQKSQLVLTSDADGLPNKCGVHVQTSGNFLNSAYATAPSMSTGFAQRNLDGCI